MDGSEDVDRGTNRTGISTGMRLGREILWAVLTIAFAVYVGTGRVSTYLGAQGRGRAAVWDVWQNLAGDLPGGDSFLPRAAYVLMLIAFVGGSLAALWLALAADGSDESTERPVADVP
jgi:hypothetical protein